MMEKVLVCITPQQNSKRLIDKGYEIAKEKNGRLDIVCVEKGTNIFMTQESSLLLQELFDYGSEYGGTIHGLCGDDIARTIIDFIEKNKITTVVMGASAVDGLIPPQYIPKRLQDEIPHISLHIIQREQQ